MCFKTVVAEARRGERECVPSTAVPRPSQEVLHTTTTILAIITLQLYMDTAIDDEFRKGEDSGESAAEQRWCRLKSWCQMSRPLRKVAFFHLDLGVGGAEQLILQAALQTHKLIENNHLTGTRVDAFTSYFDPQRCLEAAKSPELRVTVFGSFLPQTVLGRFRAACSTIRMFYLVLAAVVTGHVGYDVVFNDQVSAVNPLLRLVGKKVVFYGHFPDLLLAHRKRSFLWRLYRYPLDRLEALTTAMCHLLLVNSHFTAETFTRTFPSLRREKMHVLYPPVSTDIANASSSDNLDGEASFHGLKEFLQLSSPYALSLNRFEGKKNIELAIRAVASLSPHMQCNLVVAGGFDPRLPECSKCLGQLAELSKRLDFRVYGCSDIEGLSFNSDQDTGGRRRVLFLKNISSTLKVFLLKRSLCLLYTPTEEHFGITPCEAMYVGCLPVACNSGGPMETILDGETGFLCNPTPEAFSAALARLLRVSTEDPRSLEVMKSKAKRHAARRFSPGVFGRSLEALLESIAGPRRMKEDDLLGGESPINTDNPVLRQRPPAPRGSRTEFE
ncbi:hypothetical protein Esti_003660 [Eimeria stiedai]